LAQDSSFRKPTINNLAIKPSTASPAFHFAIDGRVKGTKTFPEIFDGFG